jgi:hypothetical protein
MDHGLSPDLDEILRATVLSVLSANGLNAVVELHVGAINGIVHLAGRVDSMAMRNDAEVLARSIPGVRGVVNRIEAPGAPSPTRIVNLDLDRMTRNKE